MGVVGTLLKNRRAGEKKLAWNLPNLNAPETLTLTSDAFGDGEAIPAEYAGKRPAAKTCPRSCPGARRRPGPRNCCWSSRTPTRRCRGRSCIAWR